MPAFGCGSFRVVEDEFDDGDGNFSSGGDRFRWWTRRRQTCAWDAGVLCREWHGGDRFGRSRDEGTSDDDGRGGYILWSKETSCVLCWGRSALARLLRSRLRLLRVLLGGERE